MKDGMVADIPISIPLGQTNLGFWIQTGAFILSAVAAVLVIYHNGRMAKKRATIDLVLHQKSDRELIDALSTVYDMHRDKKNFFDHLPTLQSEEGKCIRLVLNSHEFVALGIRRGAFDETLYKEMQCTNFLKVWDATRGLIQEIRRQQSSETIFQEFEWLAKRWKKCPVKSLNK